jgi:hypothetical protein
MGRDQTFDAAWDEDMVCGQAFGLVKAHDPDECCGCREFGLSYAGTQEIHSGRVVKRLAGQIVYGPEGFGPRFIGCVLPTIHKAKVG